MKKVVVIGAGISGLSISRMLSSNYQVSILEKSHKIGGLIKCDRIDGNLFHTVGGHVFNSKNHTVLNWFWQHFDQENEFLKARRNAKILLNNKFIGYPLENYLYQLPKKLAKEIIEDLIDMLANNKETPTYNNFKDFLLGNFGKSLYRLYFGPYNSKIWATDISKVPLEWLDGKLPMPQIKEVILNNILRKKEVGMVHSYFYYPKRNGSQFIIDRLAQQQQINVSYRVASIKLDSDKQLLINNGDTRAEVIIYCGDVRELFTIIDIQDIGLIEALKAVVNLRSNGTSNVLCENDDCNISWLYLPEEKYKAHRIIYTGGFSPSNNEGTTRQTCVVEFSGKAEKADMINEIQRLPGNLHPLAFNYEPNSYIIQEKETRNLIKNLKAHLSKYNIYLLGRFAEWEYYNMDKCIEAAMQLRDELIYST